MELLESQKKLNHDREVDMATLHASHMLKTMEMAITSMSSSSSQCPKVAVPIKTEPTAKVPISQLGMLGAMKACIDGLTSVGADISGANPAEIIKFAIGFLDNPMVLQADVAAAATMKDKLNFVVDALLN